jgi:hypothetical protein
MNRTRSMSGANGALHCLDESSQCAYFRRSVAKQRWKTANLPLHNRISPFRLVALIVHEIVVVERCEVETRFRLGSTQLTG